MSITRNKINIVTSIVGTPILVILFLCVLAFWAYTSWSMPSAYSYGEYVFTSYNDEFPIPNERLFYETKEGYSLRVIALKEIDDIEAFICGGGYNWDQIPPDECRVESHTENSIKIYTLSDNLGDDSISEKELKFTFRKSEEGYYLSKREFRQRCVPGRGWSLSLYPGNCS